MIWLFFATTAAYTFYLIKKTAEEDDKKMSVCSSYDRHSKTLSRARRR